MPRLIRALEIAEIRAIARLTDEHAIYPAAVEQTHPGGEGILDDDQRPDDEVTHHAGDDGRRDSVRRVPLAPPRQPARQRPDE
jgi:hypothetical protein